MSELGVKCSRGLILHADCRVCALNPLHPCGFTPDLLELMRTENSREPSANSFSPSRLLSLCDRQRVLQNKHDYYVDIDQQWAFIRGHMVHALLEGSGRYPGVLGVVREVRLETTIELPYGRTYDVGAEGTIDPGSSATFTGKSDFIGLLRHDADGRLHCKIVDYKTKKYLAAGFTDVAADKFARSNVMQINMYRWLVERCLPAALGIDTEVVVDEMELLYLDMSRTARFTSAGDITFGKRTYKAIPVIPSDEVERWIVRKIKEKRRAEIVLPPVLKTKDTKEGWLCQRCPVYEVCSDIQEQENANELE